jgi:hypothetical protein
MDKSIFKKFTSLLITFIIKKIMPCQALINRCESQIVTGSSLLLERDAEITSCRFFEGIFLFAKEYQPGN